MDNITRDEFIQKIEEYKRLREEYKTLPRLPDYRVNKNVEWVQLPGMVDNKHEKVLDWYNRSEALDDFFKQTTSCVIYEDSVWFWDHGTSSLDSIGILR